MKPYDLLAPLGILSYTFLAVAFLSGILKFKFHVRWINMKWHMWAGILAIIFASLHVAIVIYANS